MGNHHLVSSLLLGAALAMPLTTASAQGTVEDYNRAYALRHQFSSDSVFHWARQTEWSDVKSE